MYYGQAQGLQNLAVLLLLGYSYYYHQHRFVLHNISLFETQDSVDIRASAVWSHLFSKMWSTHCFSLKMNFQHRKTITAAECLVTTSHILPKISAVIWMFRICCDKLEGWKPSLQKCFTGSYPEQVKSILYLTSLSATLTLQSIRRQIRIKRERKCVY